MYIFFDTTAKGKDWNVVTLHLIVFMYQKNMEFDEASSRWTPQRVELIDSKEMWEKLQDSSDEKESTGTI